MLRTTQELGPSHTIDLNGAATTVRTATWNDFDDGNHVVYSASGYATGPGPTYTYTLVNPVSITKRDADGVVLEQIEAASATTSGSLSAIIIAAAGSGALAFPQSSYTQWTTTQYTDCCLAASHRVYPPCQLGEANSRAFGLLPRRVPARLPADPNVRSRCLGNEL